MRSRYMSHPIPETTCRHALELCTRAGLTQVNLALTAVATFITTSISISSDFFHSWGRRSNLAHAPQRTRPDLFRPGLVYLYNVLYIHILHKNLQIGTRNECHIFLFSINALFKIQGNRPHIRMV